MKLSSSVSMGRVAYEHDVRNSTQMKNVDYSKSNQNVIIRDKLKDEPGKGMERIMSFTDKKYQKYVDEYNKGKKPCRQIKDGYSKHFYENQMKGINAGRKPAQLAYEVVIQMGNRDNIGKEFYDSWKMNDRTPEQLKGDFVMIYSDVLREFEERFKHFDVLMATIHFDEPNGTPHMHVIFQPDGQGYEKGLSQQVSLSRALACDGFERRETRSKSDFQFVRASKYITEEIMPKIMKFNGYEWENDGHSIGRAHVDSKDYPKHIQDAIAQGTKEREEISKENDALHEENDALHERNEGLLHDNHILEHNQETLINNVDILAKESERLEKKIEKNADTINRQADLAEEMGLMGPDMNRAIKKRMKEMVLDSEDLER